MNSDVAARGRGGSLPPHPEVTEDKPDQDAVPDSAAALTGISPSFKACPFQSPRKSTNFALLPDSTHRGSRTDPCALAGPES